MSATERIPISVSLALDAISEATEAVLRLEQQLAEARHVRNELILDAAPKVKAQTLQQYTGLSREQLYRIKNSEVLSAKRGV